MVHPLTEAASAVLTRVVAESRGRLVALLAAADRDIGAAEDALADAVERALLRWPADGVPANPEGWLLVAARNRLRDRWKSAAHRTSVALDESMDRADEFDDDTDLPDRRLALLLVCAHPAISASMRAPLMLQVVLGVDADAIARAYAVTPTAMAQRLVRAKQRIRATGIPFHVPDRELLDERLPAVLEAVYGAYAIDWQLVPEGNPVESLSAEAVDLALLLAELLPDEPEVLGLAALTCLTEARRAARTDAAGRFVPLDDQDVGRWNRRLIAKGEQLLRRAHAMGTPGRYQYEAAIQSAHCSRTATGPLDRPTQETLRALHHALLRESPSLGAAVALASLVGELDGPQAGLAALDGCGAGAEEFQPALVVRAHLLASAGRWSEADAVLARAIAATSVPEVARFLEDRLREGQS